MSFIKSEDSKKWINFLVAIVSGITCYVIIKFVGQLGEWFDLEAKIGHFLGLTQALGIVGGIATFAWIVKNKTSSTHLQEVYDELVKVIWPDRDTVIKVTVGIVIGVSIISSIFVGVDFLFRKLLELFY